jgi:hypothetical protein
VKGSSRLRKQRGQSRKTKEEAWTEFLAEFGDVRTEKFGTAPTWSGLTDLAVFELMGWGTWYDMYALFSESVHAGFRSLQHPLDDVVMPEAMPASGGDPYLALFASYLSTAETIGQMDTLLKWGRRTDADTIVGKYRAALHDYALERGAGDTTE